MAIVKYGVETIRNEAQYIEEWAQMMLFFCEEVTVLLDPMTSDNTRQILETKFPSIQIVEQDRSLGDSDEEIEGPTRSTIMHCNKTQWIQEHIPLGEWFLEIAADERFADWVAVAKEVTLARDLGFDGLIHTQLIEPVPAASNQISYQNGQWVLNAFLEPSDQLYDGVFMLNWGKRYDLRHARFQKRTADWEQCAQPHSGFKHKCYNPLFSIVPLVHYHRMKTESIFPSSWRDARGSITKLLETCGDCIPVFPYCNTQNTLGLERIVEIKTKNKTLIKNILGATEEQMQTREEYLRTFRKQAKNLFTEVAIDSSMFDKVGYNYVTETLRLWFKKYKYQYTQVPPQIYAQFLRSESKGKFFHTMIKPKYTGETFRE